MWLVILLSAGIAACATAKLEGDHICPQQERYTVNVTRMVLQTFKIRNYKWCMSVPPRCSFYTDEERYVPEVVEQEEARTVNKCCTGYQEDEKSEKCIPHCLSCIHGECELNNKCNCHPGFWGDACDKECSATRWGRNCEFDCSCKRGDCDPVTGYCICPPGWKGNRCEEWLLITPMTTTTETSISTKHATTQQQVPNITEVENLEQRLKSISERPKYPLFQKYYTFYITTQIPLPVTESKPDHLNEVGSWQPPQVPSATEKIPPVISSEHFPNTKPTSLTLLSDRNRGETTTHNHIKSSTINAEQKSGYSKSQPRAEVDTVTVPVAHVTTTLREDDEAKQEQEFVNNKITDQVVSVTQSHVNLKAKVVDGLEVSVTSTQTIFAREENWLNDESRLDLENESPIHQNQTPINDSNLVFSIGAAAGVTATIILIVAVALLTTQNYRRKKPATIVSVATKSKNDHGDVGTPAVAIYARSVFHAPLPEPPVFENPVFTTPMEYENNPNEFEGTLEAHVICSMQLSHNHPSYRRDSRLVDAFYDHPPSTGSYRAASIPEPPEHSLEAINGEVKEHLYDEIPCWKQPLPVKQPTNVLSTEAMSYYANTSTRL